MSALTAEYSVPSFMDGKDDVNALQPTMSIIHLPIPCIKDKYVSVINNVFSKQECDELIAWSENIGYKDALVNLGFGYQHQMNEFRKHKKISLDNREMAHFIFNRCATFIPKQFDNRSVIDINERLRFLRYGHNEYFGAHYDGMYVRTNNQQRSLITIVIYLNETYNGGEITFLHPTNENVSHSIKPKTGMVLLFEQNELFHQGSIVKIMNSLQDSYKYCIRSDVMYSKTTIHADAPSSSVSKSYEVEKQTVYFQRNKMTQTDDKYQKYSQSKPSFTRKHNRKNLTEQIVSFWLIEAAVINVNMHSYHRVFPIELYDVISKYFPIVSVLDFVCDSAGLLRLAKMSESAERYREMVEIMSELTELHCYTLRNNLNHNLVARNEKTLDSMDDGRNTILSVEARNLLSVAFKNFVGELRASWRSVKGEIDTLNGIKSFYNYSYQPEEEKKENTESMDEETKQRKLFVCSEYLKVIETELRGACLKILDLLEHHVVETIENCKMERSVDAIFYFKMTGDYWRYIAELNITEEDKQKCEMYYERASLLANELLPPTSAILLGLKLNYSVFLYEIKKDGTNACKISKAAFDGAIKGLDSLDDDTYKDSTLIMRLLRDNLTLWTSDMQESEENKNEMD